MNVNNKPGPKKATLRTQLLSTDIGNIDITKENPINSKQPQQQFMPYGQQQQQFYPQPPPNGMPQGQIPNPNFQRNGPGPGPFPPLPQQNGQFHPGQPPMNRQFQHPPPQQQQPPSSPHSRKSSMTSNHPSNFSNFMKFGKPKKKGFRSGGGGDDDDEDDGKDVMVDSDQMNSMSFDDLSTIRDRGRYGLQPTYDTAPIIPTLQSAPIKPNGNVSGVQYRKQMTAMRKQAFNNASKVLGPGGDPRAMSLQSGMNPFQYQGGGPMNGPPTPNDPRSMSMTGPNPMFYPRANSLASGGPPPAFQSRANSLASGGPPKAFQSRANSLATSPQFQQPPLQNGYRTQSLTHDNYFQQRGPMPPNHPGHFNPGGPPPPHMRPGPSPYQGPIPPPNGQHGGPPPMNPNKVPLNGSYPPTNNQRPSLPPTSRSSLNSPSLQQNHQPQQQPQQQAQSNSSSHNSQISSQNFNSNRISQPPEPLSPVRRPTLDPGRKIEDTTHHFLADNTQNNSNLDVSGQSFSDLSTTRDNSKLDESTPSPKMIRKPPASDTNDNNNNNDNRTPTNNNNKTNSSTFYDTPSKIPRSKALPHLSLLKMRDDDDDDDEKSDDDEDDDREVNEQTSEDTDPELYESHDPKQQSIKQKSAKYDFVPRVLEPLDESRPFQGSRSTPPLNGTISTPNNHSQNNYNQNTYNSHQNTQNNHHNNHTPNKEIPTQQPIITSPHKKLNSNNDRMHNKNQPSTSSNYSTVSDNQDYTSGNDKKIYQLADQSTTNPQDVFVTASQFSLMSDNDDSTVKHSPFEYGDTPKLKKNNTFDDTTPIIRQHQNRSPPKHESRSPKRENRSPKRENKSPKRENRSPKHDNISINSNNSKKEKLISPKFFKRWSKRKPYESTDIMNDIYGPQRENSGTSNNYISPSSDNSNNPDSQGETGNSMRLSSASSTPPSSTKGDEPKLLAESFVPKRLPIKELNLTVDQLGIMEDKTALMRELDLVSNELAASIKRELALEEKVYGTASSPQSTTNYRDEQLRSSALEISRLTQLLNEERKKRYIAEEHVLLQEHGVRPSPLELSFENEQLKSDLSTKDEIINRQSSEIESLKKEIPKTKAKYEELKKSHVLLKEKSIRLKNEVEVLKDDRKKLSILTQKFKILKSEKAQLEKELSIGLGMGLNYSSDGIHMTNDNDTTTFKNQRNFMTKSSLQSPNISSDELRSSSPSPQRPRRLASFSLLSVSSPVDN